MAARGGWRRCRAGGGGPGPGSSCSCWPAATPMPVLCCLPRAVTSQHRSPCPQSLQGASPMNALQMAVVGLLFCVRDSLLTSCLLTGTSFLASCCLTTNTFQLVFNARRCGRRAGHRSSVQWFSSLTQSFRRCFVPSAAVGLGVHWFCMQTGPRVSQRGR